MGSPGLHVTLLVALSGISSISPSCSSSACSPKRVVSQRSLVPLLGVQESTRSSTTFGVLCSAGICVGVFFCPLQSVLCPGVCCPPSHSATSWAGVYGSSRGSACNVWGAGALSGPLCMLSFVCHLLNVKLASNFRSAGVLGPRPVEECELMSDWLCPPVLFPSESGGCRLSTSTILDGFWLCVITEDWVIASDSGFRRCLRCAELSSVCPLALLCCSDPVDTVSLSALRSFSTNACMSSLAHQYLWGKWSGHGFTSLG